MVAKNKKYTVKNASGGSMGFNIDGKYKKMPFADMEKQLTLDEIQDIYDSRGGRVLIEEDLLMIKDSGVRKDVANLAPLDEYVLDAKGFELLFSDTMTKIEDFLMYCSDTMLIRAVDEAVRLKIGDITTINLLKEYAGQDISAIVDEKLEGKKKLKVEEPKTKVLADGAIKKSRVKKTDK